MARIGPAVAAQVGPGDIGVVVVEADAERGVACRVPENGALNLSAPQPRSERRVTADHL